jgi:putative ATP-binding cassette transporter
MPRLNRRLWKRFLAIAAPYWFSNDRWRARGLVALLIVLLVVYTRFDVLFVKKQGDLISALADKDAGRFGADILQVGLLLLIAVPVNSFYYYVRDRLAVAWRRWLTHQFLGDYFAHRAYYDLASNQEIDNPDQRIADDINSFTQRSLQFLLVILNSVMQLIAFSLVLWGISRLLVFFLVGYAVVGTGITAFIFGRALTRLNYALIKREADFRFSLVRVRENVENIAFYQGEDREETLVRKLFDSVYRKIKHLIQWQLFLNGFQYLNSYLTYLLPYIILAPIVLAGEIEVGVVQEAAGAFSRILVALNLVIDNFDGLTRFAAGIDRLDAFAKFLKSRRSERTGAEHAIEYKTGPAVRIEHLTLPTPNQQRVLIDDVSLEVGPGDGLVIAGPSGCGKTSLLRAIAGLWTSGTGTITRPDLDEILFLPQRPYLILGTLRDQLLYPRIDLQVSDDELRRVLEIVNLERLAKQEDSLDAELDWAKVLSMGEQQRLSFARLLLLNPKVAILDEATSALDPANEHKLYGQLAGRETTLISVSHHKAILQYHRYVLNLVGDGQWDVREVAPDDRITRPDDRITPAE